MLKRITSALLVVAATIGMVGLVQTMPVAADHNPNHNPPGNNGTIKIGEVAVEGEEGSNANDPHIAGCSLNVKFFGYDSGARSATVTFESQAPTLGTLVSPIGAQTFNFMGGGPGSQLDATAQYTLMFQGAPQTNQGYHVKVTVHADGSQGNDTKSKVFWVEGCESEEETSPNTTVSAVCVVAEQVVKLTFTNTGTADSTVTVNGTEYTVPADDSVVATVPITGATVNVAVTIDGETIEGVTAQCPTGGSGNQGENPVVPTTPVSVVVNGGGAGAVTEEVASLPVTSGGSDKIAAIVVMISSVLATIGAYVVRMRTAVQL